MAAPDSTAGGRLDANITHFARLLRAAGMNVGTGKVIDAVGAAEVVGLSRRDDFYWALRAVFVTRRRQQPIFDQAFALFWRDPKLLERLMGVLLPHPPAAAGGDEGEPVIRRLAEALAGPAKPRAQPPQAGLEVDAALTASNVEVLQDKDFEQMSGEELARAKAAIAAMRLPVAEVATRRFKAAANGRKVDLRATLRAARHAGGGFIPLCRTAPRRRPPPLVLLCDISGSMQRYSRMLLHFMHRLSADRERVSSFLFGTRLTNISRHLRHRDVDVALNQVTGAVEDWSGGTRIGACLRRFNRDWSRRVLAQGAVVIFISDGLDRDAGEGLAGEMARLHRSCRRLIWLNPLLRFEGFAPKSLGIRAILPHVDDFRPVHDLRALGDLARALSRPAGDGGNRLKGYRRQIRETGA